MTAQNKPSKDLRPVDIVVRQPQLDYASLPKYWFGNDPFLSTLFSVFSATLPEGEKQFIHSLRHFQKKITDPVLQKEVRAFIGQEAHHARQHDLFNDRLQELGYDVAELQRIMADLFERLRGQLSPQRQLAMTVCVEHFTAMIASFFLVKRPETADQLIGAARDIWVWHVVEEMEHKAVAFDVYDQLAGDPSRIRLRLTMVIVTAMMTGRLGWHTYKVLKGNGESRNFKSIRGGLKFVFGKGGMMRSMSREYFDFFKRDFHPWQHDTRREMEEWKTQYEALFSGQ